jgi:hypothetical protein
MLRNFDPLERYKEVKNHAMFAFRPVDAIVANLIGDSLNDINAMSGDICDVYVSPLQTTVESAYVMQDLLPNISAMRHIRFHEAPVLVVWSKKGAGVLPLREPSECG